MTDRAAAYLGLVLGLFLVTVVGVATVTRCAPQQFWATLQSFFGQCR